MVAVEERSPKRLRVVPKFQIGDEIPMGFQLKDCDMRKWEIGTLVSTADMSEVMDNFGSFPAEYYVRQEEIYVFKTIWNHWEGNWSKAAAKLTQIAILGSHGVGKSTFIMFVAFCLARLESRSVLLLHRVKGPYSVGSTCVVLSQDSYFEVKVILGNIVDALGSLLKKFPGLLFFVDGFAQGEVKSTAGLGGFLMLVTSSQFTRKSDDPTQLVVLPGWQFCDLQDFACKSKTFEHGIDAEEGSRVRYYYFGGSLREFCRELPELKDRVKKTLSVVGGTAQAFALVSEYGGVAHNQVDSLRRRYKNDHKDKEQYKLIDSTFVVDSGYVLRSLIRQCDKGQYEKVYNFTKAFGEVFRGRALESCLHKLAVSGGFTIHTKKYMSHDPQVQYEIKCSELTSEGTNESDCKTSLRKWASNDKSKYWYPDYS